MADQNRFVAQSNIAKASGVAASLMAEKLGSMIRPDGQFLYSYNLNPEIEDTKDYNWLRHFGAIYSLIQAHDAGIKSIDQNALQLAIQFACDKTIGAVEKLPETLGVWSRPDFETYLEKATIKTGGVGLALCVLSKAAQRDLFEPDHSKLSKLSSYLKAAQKKDGSFYSFYFEDVGLSDERTSLYYPGEAALGLISHYAYSGDKSSLEAATQVLLYLEESRRTDFVLPPDHWALIASAAVVPLINGEAKMRVIDHAKRVTRKIISDQILEPNSILAGGFAQDGRTTPTATRLEGLNAAASIFRADTYFWNEIMRSIEYGIAFLARSTFSEGPHKGAVPGAIVTRSDATPEAKVFNEAATEVRIDFIQHALSACLGYQENIR